MVIKIDDSKIKIKCQKCDYVWDYGGKSEYYVTCPRCHTLDYVRKLKIKLVLIKGE